MDATDIVVNKREFARIDVRLPVTLQPLVNDEQVRQVREEILGLPSVWAPTNEATLRELSSSGGVGPEAVLAQAVLELTAQIGRLRSRVLENSAPIHRAELIQLSGGGGQLLCDFPLDQGDYFEMRFEDNDDGIPAIRMLGEVVHRRGKGPLGVRFSAVHAQDKALLIRLIYKIQRQALRRSRLR